MCSIWCQKTFSFLSYVNFLSWFFGHILKCLNKKAKADVQIDDVTDWQANNYNVYIPNISKSKCNKTVKSGQLIEYNVRMVFLQESSGANLGHFLTLAYWLRAHLFWVPRSRKNIQPIKKSLKPGINSIFKSILSLRTSIKWWLLGILPQTPCLAG